MIGDLFIRIPRMRNNKGETGSREDIPGSSVPETLIETAVIIDRDGTVEYPANLARQGYEEGHYTYLGYRTIGNIVEHHYRFN